VAEVSKADKKKRN